MIGRLFACVTICLGLTSGMAQSEMMWGVNGHPITAYPGVPIADQMDLLEGLGAKSYRVNISHPEEASKLGDLIAAGKARNITILPVLTPGVDMVNESAEALYQQSFDFAVALSSVYRDDVPVWELGNESENFAIILPCETRDDGTLYPCDWGPAGGLGVLDYQGARWKKVSAVLRGLSEGISTVDPSLRKAIGTAGWGHLGAFERMLKDGIDWDISVWHYYGEDPEWAFAELARYGRPIWVTEFNNPYGSKYGDERQADGLKRLMLRLRELSDLYDVEAAHVYELLDEPYWAPSFEAVMGLVTLVQVSEGSWRPGSPKAAYHAMREIVQREAADLQGSQSSGEDAHPLGAAQAAYAVGLLIREATTIDLVRTWSIALSSGEATVPEMLEVLIRSTDFRASSAIDSADDAEYVREIYRILLGRAADDQGLGELTSRLADGSLSRTDLAVAATRSEEFLLRHPILFEFPALPPEDDDLAVRECDMKTVAAMGAPSKRRVSYAYCLMLGRMPNSAELADGMTTLDRGASTADLLTALFTSAEFTARFQLPSRTDAEFVNLVYRLFLGREPDGAGRDSFLKSLSDGTVTRATVASEALGSFEFAQLHPGLAATAASVSEPQAERRSCDTANAMASADELSAKRVAYAYCVVLGRLPATPELEYWTGFYVDSNAGIDDLVLNMIGSDAFHKLYTPDDLSNVEFITLMYELLLGRSPDGQGLETFVPQLASGAMSRDAFVRGAIWSSEFAEKHTALVVQ